jgi:hypothetical protein
VTGRDPRQHGSGHTGGLNVYGHDLCRVPAFDPPFATGDAGDAGGGDVPAVCGGLGEGVWGGGARNLAFRGSRLHFDPSQPAITHKSVCAHFLSIRCGRIFIDKISFVQ